jgi:hypothetical protein
LDRFATRPAVDDRPNGFFDELRTSGYLVMAFTWSAVDLFQEGGVTAEAQGRRFGTMAG